MLDIHLPHKSIRGFSEFLIHLFTITVGLLIAVQIESFVEWRHHLHLAEEARVAMRLLGAAAGWRGTAVVRALAADPRVAGLPDAAAAAVFAPSPEHALPEPYRGFADALE